jgi:hypothetical protein
MCITCRLTITRTKHTECSTCRRFRDGDAPIKQREASLKTYLDNAITGKEIPSYTSHDKAIALGLDPVTYGATRPDFVWVLPDRWVVLECDEAQHASKAYSCERRRELQICNCASGLPVIFIRFNPDTFKTGSKSSRVKVAGEAIAQRQAVVVSEIRKAVECVNPTGLTFVKLFFDCTCVADSSSHPCKFIHSSNYADHETFLLAFQ